MKHMVLIACLAFGFIMITSFARAQEVEGVYCRFDVKEWNGSLLGFLKSGSDCEVKVNTEWGSFEYTQPLIVDPEAFNPLEIWSALADD
jgi:hypothetical protein